MKMIKHIDNKPIKTLKNIAKYLGKHTESIGSTKYVHRKQRWVVITDRNNQPYTGKRHKSKLLSVKKEGKYSYDITKDDVCTYKSLKMFDLQSISEHLNISKRQLLYLKKDKDFPLYNFYVPPGKELEGSLVWLGAQPGATVKNHKHSQSTARGEKAPLGLLVPKEKEAYEEGERPSRILIPKDKKDHKGFFVLKNSIAHWYFDYLMSRFGPVVLSGKELKLHLLKTDTELNYMQRSYTRNYNRLLNFAKKVKCAYCGDNLFLIPGVNCKKYSLEEIINNLPIKQLINNNPNPKCPECREAIFPCSAFHEVFEPFTGMPSLDRQISL